MGVDVTVILFDYERYLSVLIPAFDAARQSGDTQGIASLLEETAQSPTASKWADLPQEVLDEFLGILRGEVPYSVSGNAVVRDVTTHDDMMYFIRHLCVPDLIGLFIPEVAGFVAEQNMSRSTLPRFLYERSEWIEEYFTFSREVSGPVVEPPFGEWCGLFSPSEVDEFHRELLGISPLEDPVLAREVTNLQRLVAAAHANKCWSLLMRLQ
ncbi:MAG TPA: hypothetical protein VGN16_03315 [Acidobacteriaceae bacterium]|jgi:hypothetical protein